MPTIGIYVPMKTARQVAATWKLNVNDPEFMEVVRSICSAALESEGGLHFDSLPQKKDCEFARFHVPKRRCRHCGGS